MTGRPVSTEGRGWGGPSRDFTDDDDYIEVGPDAPSPPSPPNEAQLYNRALSRWHIERQEKIEAEWDRLASDLLEGRIHGIPAHHSERIEDALTRRVKHFFPRVPDFLAAWWWAEHGMPVFPQQPNKAPLIRSPHPMGSRERVMCKRACGQDGHGHLDATTDRDHLRSWGQAYGLGWGGFAGRLGEGFFDIEDDPRHGGHRFLERLQADHGALPATLEIISGRGDGGRHRIYSAPNGLKLDGHRLVGTGVDFKDHNSGVRLPLSTHHVSSMPYLLVSRAVVPAPGWLLALLLADPKRKEPFRSSATQRDSIADWFCQRASWSDLLTAHNWLCVAGDGDSDGSRWRHPNATADSSASIAYGHLFVFSTSCEEFEATSPGDAHGYSLFRAYALLEHSGDMKAAAAVLRDEKKAGIW